MEDFTSKHFSIIILMIMLVFIPTLYVLRKADNMSEEMVKTKTFQFVENVKLKGYISYDMYDDFLKELCKTKRKLNVSILHGKPIKYPLEPGNPEYTSDKPYKVIYDEYGEKQILNEYVFKHKDYKMNKNDRIEITVVSEDMSSYSALTYYIFKMKENKIYASYGGLIENESY